MKKLLLVLSLALVSLTGFAQTTAPDATKPYLIFDASYNLAPLGATPTNVAIYYDNAGATAIKAVQIIIKRLTNNRIRNSYKKYHRAFKISKKTNN